MQINSDSIQLISRVSTEENPVLFEFISLGTAVPMKNLELFIQRAREELYIPGDKFDWTHWSWPKVGTFLKLGSPRRINNPENLHLDSQFIDFAKAIIRYEHCHHPSHCATTQRLAAIRCIEAALLTEKGHADPIEIDLLTLDKAAQLVRENFSRSAGYNIGRMLAKIADSLSRYALTKFDTAGWVSPIPSIVKMGLKLGADADRHRQDKIPSMVAINALGAMFARGFDITDNTKHADVYVTSCIGIMMSQPCRVSEVHELKIDLEIEEVDLEGDMQYGFRFRSLKSMDGTRIKWVPAVWVPIAKEAVRRIREITKGARTFASYVESQMKMAKANPNFTQQFYRHAACPDVDDDAPLTPEQTARALGFKGTSIRSFLNTRGLSGRTGAYTLTTLWLEVLKRLPTTFPYAPSVTSTQIKYSEALFCMHTNQIKFATEPDPLSLWVPNRNSLSVLLANNNPHVLGFFERHAITDENGAIPAMRSHQIRHLLNSLGHEGTGETFLSAESINYWSGRDSAWQGTTYNHVPAEEFASRAGAAIERRNVIELDSGVAQLASPDKHWSVIRSPPVSCADIELQHRSAVLMTFWGACEHDWLLEPCMHHKDCLNCREHFCLKGYGTDDQERLGRLKDLLQKIICQEQAAKNASDAGEYGAINYYEYQKTYRERVEQLIGILEDTSVPDGAKVRLSSIRGTSHLQRVLAKVSTKQLQESTQASDIVASLVRAYEEDRSSEVIMADAEFNKK